jgi:peptide/nickel transport system substrate-binding protein
METFAGSNFMEVFNSWYYSFSPYIADAIRESPITRAFVRVALYPLFGILNIAASSFQFLLVVNPEFSIIASGILASSMIGLVYAAPLIFMVLLVAKKKMRLEFTYRWIWGLLLVFGLSLVGVLLAEFSGLAGLMMFSTAALVLSSLLCSALAAAGWLSKIIKIK